MVKKHLVTAQDIFNVYYQSGESNLEWKENGATAITAYLSTSHYSKNHLRQIAIKQFAISKKELKDADQGQIVQKIVDKVTDIAQRSSAFGDY